MRLRICKPTDPAYLATYQASMPFRLSGYEGEEAWTLVYRHESKVSKSDKTGPQEAAKSFGAEREINLSRTKNRSAEIDFHFCGD